MFLRFYFYHVSNLRHYCIKGFKFFVFVALHFFLHSIVYVFLYLVMPSILPQEHLFICKPHYQMKYANVKMLGFDSGTSHIKNVLWLDIWHLASKQTIPFLLSWMYLNFLYSKRNGYHRADLLSGIWNRYPSLNVKKQSFPHI